MALMDGDNRLLTVTLGGGPLPPEVADNVLSATMSYSAQQMGEFTLTVQDIPDADLIVSGAARRGQPVDYAGQHMIIRTVRHRAGKGGPVVEIKARSTVVAALKGQTGKRSWGTVDVRSWASGRVAAAGGSLVSQPLGKDAVTRQDDTGSPESTLDVLRRLADQAGAWLFEADQTVYLARPSHLVKRAAATRWQLDWSGHSSYSELLTGRPEYRGSDDGDQGERLDLQLLGAEAGDWRPGHVLTLTGRVGEASGTWLVTDVDIPGTMAQPVRVSAQRPTDPEPAKAG